MRPAIRVLAPTGSGILTRPTLEAFAAAFTVSPTLSASVLRQPLVGIGVVRGFFLATRGMYDRIAFTEETVTETQTLLAWEGIYRGAAISGVTILDQDPHRAVATIRLFRQPYDQVVAFAADLTLRLARDGDLQ